MLGVAKSSSAAEIKKAYHKLAMKYHPDRSKGDKSAEAKFKEVNEAYEVLSNAQKKAAYDQYGPQAFETGGSPKRGGGGAHSEASGAGFGGFHFSGGFGGINFDDILNEVFGAGFGRGASQPRSVNLSQPGEDARFDLSLSLEEAFSGTVKHISFRIFCSCKKCRGLGSADAQVLTVCSACKGTGFFHSQQGFFTIERTCTSCGGAGRVIKNPCVACSGLGRVRKEKELDVKIPRGVDEGTRIHLVHEGAAGVRGGQAGDLYLFISVKKHALFQRKKNDLTCLIPISITTASLGKEIDIPALNKTPLSLKIPAGTQTGCQFRVRGQGMPDLHGATTGDLLVEVVVETPIKLTTRQKELLQELDETGQEAKNNPLLSSFFSKVRDFFADHKG
ncbi:chaperone protein DnaJ [Alphaproteobacteria bacterium]|nr:chaperone protein DnaJ [Alphaproteobacteria bacterium]GHS99350.1 chaperone protein DnaJ [Alphaproteobacteria bacterium]